MYIINLYVMSVCVDREEYICVYVQQSFYIVVYQGIARFVSLLYHCVAKRRSSGRTRLGLCVGLIRCALHGSRVWPIIWSHGRVCVPAYVYTDSLNSLLCVYLYICIYIFLYIYVYQKTKLPLSRQLYKQFRTTLLVVRVWVCGQGIRRSMR